ncbi:MAG TPA: PQQ-binding-like beta-propeller repeat protein [Vicinamibacterales bacterium]|nr:PQQ-binding-like beta-propeller repeat protein [Vicinamibacterales bacterium]
MIAIRRVIPAAAAAAVASSIVCGVVVRTAPQPPRENADGRAVFERDCLHCHNGSEPRAPSADALRGRAPQAIVDALTSGSMRYQGLHLSGAERRAVAEFLAGRALRGSVSGATLGRCDAAAGARGFSRSSDPLGGASWNGWSPTIENTHFQAAAQAGVTAEQVPALTLKWAFGFPDTTSAWAQPTIAGGRLFVGSQNGTVYALDAKSGCIVWTFAAHSGVRTSITIGRRSGARRFDAYFADQNGFVYAVDAADGRLIWSVKADDHPLVRLTGSPALYGGRLYVPLSSYEEGGKPPGYACCTFRGGVIALDVETGETIWRAYTIPDAPTLQREYADGTHLYGPSGGAVWSAPTIDVKRGAIYVGVGNAYSGPTPKTTDAIVALDLKTGAVRWAQQMYPGDRDVFGCTPGEMNCVPRAGPDFDFGASPALVTTAAGRDLIVAGQKSGVVFALDPDRRGAQVWRCRAGGGSGLGGIQWGIAVDRDRAYAPVADIYSSSPGGLHAIDLRTGRRAWTTPAPPPLCGRPQRGCSGAQFSAVTAIPGIVFSPSNDGGVRAYAAATGSVVWTFDTNRDFMTVNGVRAKGGSMDGPAPVVAGGMVYVSSGYGTFGLRPGNVLLAFGGP